MEKVKVKENPLGKISRYDDCFDMIQLGYLYEKTITEINETCLPWIKRSEKPLFVIIPCEYDKVTELIENHLYPVCGDQFEYFSFEQDYDSWIKEKESQYTHNKVIDFLKVHPESEFPRSTPEFPCLYWNKAIGAAQLYSTDKNNYNERAEENFKCFYKKEDKDIAIREWSIEKKKLFLMAVAIKDNFIVGGHPESHEAARQRASAFAKFYGIEYEF